MQKENLGGERELKGGGRGTEVEKENFKVERNLGGEGELEGGGRGRENGRMLEENLSTALLSGK